jgi:hypothetical protein
MLIRKALHRSLALPLLLPSCSYWWQTPPYYLNPNQRRRLALCTSQAVLNCYPFPSARGRFWDVSVTVAG